MSDSDATSREQQGTDSRVAETSQPRSESATGRRDVVVPMRLYKTITVFSTLIATACILAGFILLDAATLQVSVLRNLVLLAFETVGLGLDQSLFSVLLAIAGLSLMALGSGVFILSSRFRAAGMGNSQEDTDEE